MSHLFATALLISLGATSAGLLTAINQSASTLTPGSAETVGPILAQLMAQVELPSSAALWQASVGAIAADICLNLPDWQRPSDLVQAKQLEAMPRYDTVQTDDLGEMAKAWWSHEIFSFTTYGLSARTDPLYLSGVWTALDDTWGCYSGDQPEQINQGAMAEMWLLNHRLVGLEWQGNQYVATVEPATSGLQLVQFARRESDQSLPLSIITTTGQALATMSGDW